MIDYSNPRAMEYVEKFEKLKSEFENNISFFRETDYVGKDGSTFDNLSKELHEKIKHLQMEYEDIFIS